MAFIIISVISFCAAGLTFFSGFGLGTILTPVFAVFFPLESAIAMTAVVHFLNNIFKLFLVGRYADRGIVLRFGLPAVIAAIGGALVLHNLQSLPPLGHYEWAGKIFIVSAFKMIIAVLIIIFVLLELIPSFAKMTFDRRYLVLGGILSGFFGGLSGHQGALRSAFLMKCGLSKESFIATGIVIACLIDISRISIYSQHLLSSELREHAAIIATATLCALAGSFMGSRVFRKVTLQAVQIIVSVLLIVIAVLLGAGII